MAAPTHSTGRNVIFWRKEIRQSSLLPSAWLVRESERLATKEAVAQGENPGAAAPFLRPVLSRAVHARSPLQSAGRVL